MSELQEYLSLRVVSATDLDNAKYMVEEGCFEDCHPLCDAIIPLREYEQLKELNRELAEALQKTGERVHALAHEADTEADKEILFDIHLSILPILAKYNTTKPLQKKESREFMLLLNEGEDDESRLTFGQYVAMCEEMDKDGLDDILSIGHFAIGESKQIGADHVKRIG